MATVYEWEGFNIHADQGLSALEWIESCATSESEARDMLAEAYDGDPDARVVRVRVIVEAA